MEQFVITTDNGSDLSKELIKELGIGVINLTVNVNGEEYDGLNKIISDEELYKLMKTGITPSTSQVNPENAEQFFRSYLEKGQNIVHVCLSGQISGTYNSCKIAAINLEEKYPNMKIEVIDSISASLGQGLLVIEAVKEKRKGKDFEGIVDFIKDKKHKISHIFTVGDLVYLQRGGRISKTEAVIGSLLGIKPILSCDSRGRLVSISKARGRKSSLVEIVNKMEKIIDVDKNEVITISHGDCLDDAKFVANLISERFYIRNILIGNLGPVIGAHAGPDTLAVFCIANKRLDKK